MTSLPEDDIIPSGSDFSRNFHEADKRHKLLFENGIPVSEPCIRCETDKTTLKLPSLGTCLAMDSSPKLVSVPMFLSRPSR